MLGLSMEKEVRFVFGKETRFQPKGDKKKGRILEEKKVAVLPWGGGRSLLQSSPRPGDPETWKGKTCHP